MCATSCAVLLPGYMPEGSAAGVAIEASMVPQEAFEINAEICPYGESLFDSSPLALLHPQYDAGAQRGMQMLQCCTIAMYLCGSSNRPSTNAQ
jgi:hypothetical protein